MNNNIFIHDTSIIENNVILGQGTSVWHWTHIDLGAYIGKNCVIGQNVYIGSNVKIGDGCKIQNNVSVYTNVTLQDFVFCGPSVVFTNVINPRAHLNKRNEFKSTLVKKGATLGANSTILCGTTIGEYALIGAGSVVINDVKPFSLVVGVPAKQIGWVNENADKLPLPLFGDLKYFCSKTLKTYILKNNILECILEN
jgi:UDP-2-acetamido-3-amino-2,3-dideoxy-glucuronate N-acetyltransferase